MKLGFSWDRFSKKNNPISNFTELRPLGAELFIVAKSVVAFHNSAQAYENCTAVATVRSKFRYIRRHQRNTWAGFRCDGPRLDSLQGQ